MKFLTIRQPWASLIAVGAKTIETRPFSTQYRGPLAIHAGLHRPIVGDDSATPGWYWEWDVDHGEIVWWQPPTRYYPAPLGAVVAVCDLVDVVPIVNGSSTRSYVADLEHEGDLPHQQGGLWLIGSNALTRGRPTLIEDQRPFGDFTPGRHAWLLANVRPIEPVPMKGAQGLRDLPYDVWPPHMWKEAK